MGVVGGVASQGSGALRYPSNEPEADDVRVQTFDVIVGEKNKGSWSEQSMVCVCGVPKS